MKLKTKEQFEEIADIQLCYYWGSHGRIPREGVRDLLTLTLEQHQQDLLSQVSEGFEKWKAHNLSCHESARIHDLCERSYQAAKLSQGKKMQEKDVQISELQKEIDELKKQRDIALNDLSIEAREVDELKSENEELREDVKKLLNVREILRSKSVSMRAFAIIDRVFNPIKDKWFKGEEK